MAFAALNSFSAPWQARGVNYLLLDAAFSDASPMVERVVGALQTQKPIRKPPPPPGGCAQKDFVNEKPWPTFIPFESWPEQWQNALQRTRKGLFAWTYWNLGEDMDPGNKSDAENSVARMGRSDLLKRFLRDLAHPAGTHTFLPSALQTDNGLASDPDLFWSALSRLQCRGALIFGSAAARELLPRTRIAPLTQVRVGKFLVWILWELDSLISAPDKYSRALIFLRQALKPFIRDRV